MQGFPLKVIDNKKKALLVIIFSLTLIYSFFIFSNQTVMKSEKYKGDCLNGVVTLYKSMNGRNFLKTFLLNRQKEALFERVSGYIENGKFAEVVAAFVSELSISSNHAKRDFIELLDKSWDLLVKLNTKERLDSFANKEMDLLLYSLTGNTTLAKEHKLYPPSCLIDFL